MKQKPLTIARDATTFTLWGSRADGRYGDDDLAMLAELPNLTEVTLAKQRITKLPAMRHLTTLHLGELDLESLDGIEDMVHLQSITLAGMAELDLARAFDQLAELPELVELDLWGTNVRVLPPSITKLHSVRKMCFNDTPRFDVTKGFRLLAKLPHLRSLSWVNRARQPLPDAFAPLTQVTELEILFYLRTLPPSIGHMTDLETLLLERNYFTEIPASFGKLAKLRQLDVPGSKIRAVPEALCKCTALVDLNLWGNPITALPAQFGDLVNLEKLALGYTKLTSVPASFAKLAKLRELSLPDAVTSVPEEIYALKLVELQAAKAITKRVTLAEPEALDEDQVELRDADRIPASIGQPLELRIHCDLGDAVDRLATLTRLTKLTLVDIDPVPVLAAIAEAPRLEMLNIVSAPHPAIPSLARFPALQRLYVYGKRVVLPKDLAKVPLRMVKLTSDPDAIARLMTVTSLEELVLENDVKQLPASIKKLVNLTKLTCEDGLGAFPDELAKCTRLAEIEVWSNPRKRGVGNLAVLGKLPALRRLTFKRNEHVDFVELCEALAATPLDSLDLQYTPLGYDTLPAEIGLLANLAHLDLTRTGITVLPPEIARCTALRRLVVDDGQLVDRNATKKLLPGSWKQVRDRDQITFVRSD